MFGINWTNAGQGGGGEPPAGRDRLFWLTVIAFVFMYGIVALPFLWVARPYQDSWPILLIPATPFVAVLGLWKLSTWFGFKRVAIAFFLTLIVGTLGNLLWFSPTIGIASANAYDDWIGTIVIMCGLAAWLMAAAALVIGPVRLLLGWLRRRDAKSRAVPPKQGGS